MAYIERSQWDSRLVDKFRVLIIGKANAGKTTILQKVCHTTDQPVVTDSRGRRLTLSYLAPTRGRGEHDIDREYVFKGQDRFVFHDSRGFEAGSEAELERVKLFIKKRSSHPYLNLRLHAVWYCIPSDTPRMLLEHETSFFEECRKGNVPVVAIFTKFDFRHRDAMEKLMDEGMSRREAKAAAPARARADFEAVYKQRLYDRPYPPSSHVYLYDMHLPTSTCLDLIHATFSSLTGTALRSLLISTQKNRLDLCVEYALRHILTNPQRKNGVLRRHEMKDIVVNCMIWFPLDQQDLKTAVIKTKEEGDTDREYDKNKRKWVKLVHPWEHWWKWDSARSSQWSSPWIHKIIFNDDYLEKLVNQSSQMPYQASSASSVRKGSWQHNATISTKSQVARVATVMVMLLAYICKPENQGKEGMMESRLTEFFGNETKTLDQLTRAIDEVMDKDGGDFLDLIVELKKVALDDRFGP